MAIIDSILVNIKAIPFRNKSIPTYINRDKVLFYHKYIDQQGNISEDLTSVYLPNADSQPPVIVTLSLADFNTLMTT